MSDEMDVNAFFEQAERSNPRAIATQLLAIADKASDIASRSTIRCAAVMLMQMACILEASVSVADDDKRALVFNELVAALEKLCEFHSSDTSPMWAQAESLLHRVDLQKTKGLSNAETFTSQVNAEQGASRC